MKTLSKEQWKMALALAKRLEKQIREIERVYEVCDTDADDPSISYRKLHFMEYEDDFRARVNRWIPDFNILLMQIGAFERFQLKELEPVVSDYDTEVSRSFYIKRAEEVLLEIEKSIFNLEIASGSDSASSGTPGVASAPIEKPLTEKVLTVSGNSILLDGVEAYKNVTRLPLLFIKVLHDHKLSRQGKSEPLSWDRDTDGLRSRLKKLYLPNTLKTREPIEAFQRRNRPIYHELIGGQKGEISSLYLVPKPGLVQLDVW
jgi:hypothetical protein